MCRGRKNSKFFTVNFLLPRPGDRSRTFLGAEIVVFPTLSARPVNFWGRFGSPPRPPLNICRKSLLYCFSGPPNLADVCRAYVSQEPHPHPRSTLKPDMKSVKERAKRVHCLALQTIEQTLHVLSRGHPLLFTFSAPPRPAPKTAISGSGSGRPGPGTTREDARHRGASGGETIVQIGFLWAGFRSKNEKNGQICFYFF